MRGWKTSVYRTDLDEHPDGKFSGLFEDDESANMWLAKQEDASIYEIRTKT